MKLERLVLPILGHTRLSGYTRLLANEIWETTYASLQTPTKTPELAVRVHAGTMRVRVLV